MFKKENCDKSLIFCLHFGNYFKHSLKNHKKYINLYDFIRKNPFSDPDEGELGNYCYKEFNYLIYNNVPIPFFWEDFKYLFEISRIVPYIQQNPVQGNYEIVLNYSNCSFHWELDWKDDILRLRGVFHHVGAGMEYLLTPDNYNKEYVRKNRIPPFLELSLEDFLCEFKLLMRILIDTIEILQPEIEDTKIFEEFKQAEFQIPHFGQLYRYLDDKPWLARQAWLIG